MSTRARADALLLVCLSVLWLPARIIEESIHALASLPYAESVSVRLEPRAGSAKTVVQFRADAPNWAIRAAYAAPEILATVAGVALLAWWVASGTAWWPQSAFDFLLLSVVGAQYLAIALPSGEDMDQTPDAGQA